MNERENFEAWWNSSGYVGTEDTYRAFIAGAESKQSALDKANARIAQLEEALLVWQGNDIGICESFEIGKKALLESSDTWLSQHDKAAKASG